MMPNNPAQIGRNACGRGQPLLVIAGPCVIETEELTLAIANKLRAIAESLPISLVFKASFDKANRTSLDAYRGPGLDEGLRILRRVAEVTGLSVTTDIHESYQAAPVGEVCDLLQIPAFLARQTDLLVGGGGDRQGGAREKGAIYGPLGHAARRGQTPSAGCRNILVCERGSFFGYGRLVNDMRSLPQMRELGVPVVFDATHSVQEPGGLGKSTGGNRAFVEPLARAATAIGVDGLFFETHPDPDRSPSDGPNMIPLAQFGDLLARIVRIRELVETWE